MAAALRAKTSFQRRLYSPSCPATGVGDSVRLLRQLIEFKIMNGVGHSGARDPRLRSLIGGLVATVALGVLSMMMISNSIRQARVNQELEDARKLLAAQGQLNQLGLRFARYVLEHKQIPERLEQAFSPAELLDPWGTSIKYEIVQQQTGAFRLLSAGPD